MLSFSKTCTLKPIFKSLHFLTTKNSIVTANKHPKRIKCFPFLVESAVEFAFGLFSVSQTISNINRPPLPLYREGRSVCGPQRASAGCVLNCPDARASGCISRSSAGCVQMAAAAHLTPPSQPRWSSAVPRETPSGRR